MAAPTRDIRNQIAKELLDWGFSNFSLYSDKGNTIKDIYISGGSDSFAEGYYNDFNCLVNSEHIKKISKEVKLFESLSAPLKSQTKIGEVTYKIENKIVGQSDIYTKNDIEKITVFKMFSKIIEKIFFTS